MNRLLLALFIVLQSILCFAGTIDPGIGDHQYIEYGKKFVYIGRLCGKSNDDTQFCASAVAIRPRWIATAAHVVNDSKCCRIKINDREIMISKVFVHKNFSDKAFGKNDIALGYCDENIGLDFYPELYTDKDEIGKVCSIGGFGIKGNFNTGAISSDSELRAGSNTIDTSINDLLICSPSKVNKTALEYLIASGDSGGGLFIGNKLAGIHSCVMAADKKPDSSYGDESGHTRVSIFAEWINSTISSYER
jgi:hypothetical protein